MKAAPLIWISAALNLALIAGIAHLMYLGKPGTLPPMDARLAAG